MVILCVCIFTCVDTCVCTCVSMKTEDHNCCLIPSLTVSSYTYSPAETGSPLFWQEDLASRLELLYLYLPNAKLPVGYHICGGSICVLGISISLPTCITSILPTKPSPNPYVNYSVTQNHSQHIVCIFSKEYGECHRHKKCPTLSYLHTSQGTQNFLA